MIMVRSLSLKVLLNLLIMALLCTLLVVNLDKINGILSLNSKPMPTLQLQQKSKPSMQQQTEWSWGADAEFITEPKSSILVENTTSKSKVKSDAEIDELESWGGWEQEAAALTKSVNPTPSSAVAQARVLIDTVNTDNDWVEGAWDSEPTLLLVNQHDVIASTAESISSQNTSIFAVEQEMMSYPTSAGTNTMTKNPPESCQRYFSAPYSVQVAASPNISRLKSEYEKVGVSPLYFVRAEPKRELLGFVMLGNYQTKKEAALAINLLPERVKAAKPWVRDLNFFRPHMQSCVLLSSAK